VSQILQYIRPFDVFDSETLAVIGKAYEKALVSLHDRGQKSIVREIIAVRMLDLASKGERDLDPLCKGALGSVGPQL
jgi:hypothetical protein